MTFLTFRKLCILYDVSVTVNLEVKALFLIDNNHKTIIEIIPLITRTIIKNNSKLLIIIIINYNNCKNYYLVFFLIL